MSEQIDTLVKRTRNPKS
jgi:hypothetical protein